MKYSVSPVVRVAVTAKNPADLPKLIEGLKKMSKSDPLVQVISTETEQIIAGCGELHLEICLNDLVNEYGGIEIIKSDPVVPYKETVTSASSKTCFSKSPNKHNKFWVVAEPMHDDLVKDIEEGDIKAGDDAKSTARKLIDKYDWDQHDARKLWTYGPENTGPNMLIDQTKAVQYLNEIKDSVCNAFQNATCEGVIADEEMRGCRFNILDVELHADAIHRGGAQVIPTARRVFYGAQLTATPRFQEPIFLVDISTPNDCMNGVYQVFNQRRGVVFQEDSVQGTPLLNIKAYLPVSESFGFTANLRALTSGQAFPQMVFSHWEVITSDPFDKTGKIYEILMKTRKRKGMKQEVPLLEDLIDKQ